MKKSSINKSTLTLISIFIIFVFVPFAIGATIGYQTIGGYLSSLILLLLTWLIYRRENKDLSELGLNFKRGNINFLPLGIITGILFFCVLFFAQMLHNGIHIQVNENADFLLIARGAFLLFSAVLVEELVFRGYCFKKAVDQVDILKANLIFAFLFMIWHWIALNAWGNYGMMLGLITTAFGHLLFSTALLKSGTLYFPIGIHLGNNWAAHNLFSSSTEGINTKPSNDILFILTSMKNDFSQFHTFTAYLITIACFLTCTGIIWKWRKRQMNIS